MIMMKAMIKMIIIVLMNVHNSLMIDQRSIEIFELKFNFLKFVNNEIREMIV
jgi:signal transduction histidine kinase